MDPPGSSLGGGSGTFLPGGSQQGDPFLIALLVAQLAIAAGLLIFLTARYIRTLEKALDEARENPAVPPRPPLRRMRRRRNRARGRRRAVRVKIKKKPKRNGQA